MHARHLGKLSAKWRQLVPARIITLLSTATVLACIALTPVVGQTIYFAPQNAVPLTFGMRPDDVSQVLGVPLSYVRGRPGNELLVALPNVKGAALSFRSDALYLQFRQGRLTGWKGDWGTIRP